MGLRHPAAPWIYNRGRNWYFITFKATNEDSRQVQALKVQANFVDAFGDILLTIPFSENVQLSQGGSDGAVFAFHSPVPPNSINQIDFSALAVRFADGSVWQDADVPEIGPIADASVALKRFPIYYDLLYFWPPSDLSKN
jgi:hypothetical protein